MKETFSWGEPKFLQKPNMAYAKQITIGDINSFFMLFFDNFSSLLSILAEMIFIPLIVPVWYPNTKTHAVENPGEYAATSFEVPFCLTSGISHHSSAAPVCGVATHRRAEGARKTTAVVKLRCVVSPHIRRAGGAR